LLLRSQRHLIQLNPQGCSGFLVAKKTRHAAGLMNVVVVSLYVAKACMAALARNPLRVS
jgi:hypothetical protein